MPIDLWDLDCLCAREIHLRHLSTPIKLRRLGTTKPQYQFIDVGMSSGAQLRPRNAVCVNHLAIMAASKWKGRMETRFLKANSAFVRGSRVTSRIDAPSSRGKVAVQNVLGQ
jgi:hypothetical protein